MDIVLLGYRVFGFSSEHARPQYMEVFLPARHYDYAGACLAASEIGIKGTGDIPIVTAVYASVTKTDADGEALSPQPFQPGEWKPLGPFGEIMYLLRAEGFPDYQCSELSYDRRKDGNGLTYHTVYGTLRNGRTFSYDCLYADWEGAVLKTGGTYLHEPGPFF